jgi:tetratricopeptide (TPR) repeat protein
VRRRVALAWVALAVSCGAPPWRLGRPLDGRPSIPAGQAVATPARAAAEADEARASGRRVLEIAALQKLDAAGALTDATRARLAELLAARAGELHALGRPIPESADLETVARLDPTRGAQLAPARAVAAAAAGDAWKAIGAREEARAAHLRAAALGGVSPGEIGILPRRSALPAVPAGQPPPDVDGYVLRGASLSARLLPLVTAFPWLLDDQARALSWAELLLAEDPTSPDVLELVALIWGKAGRFGGSERMLMELVYHSPERAAGLARGAAVWERVGRPREACAQWIRAARWRDDPEDPAWRKAYACARRDPGVADATAIRDYVTTRARPERREALVAALEGRPAPAGDGTAAAAGDGGAAARPDGGAAGAAEVVGGSTGRGSRDAGGQ